jgi:hypothetical protein
MPAASASPAQCADYERTAAEHERARGALQAAALDAWRAGMRPATISERTGLTTSYLRVLARKAGLPAATADRRTDAERKA